ncbi:MAG: hypothetical protein C5S45_04265 [Candidatus Methanocomedens sp.]|nr:MAG: hypothetical protein C5S45_04265 [ANME-2 cluster archaeon]
MIILAAMLRMLADLPGGCCWPADGQREDSDGQLRVSNRELDEIAACEG